MNYKIKQSDQKQNGHCLKIHRNRRFNSLKTKLDKKLPIKVQLNRYRVEHMTRGLWLESPNPTYCQKKIRQKTKITRTKMDPKKSERKINLIPLNFGAVSIKTLT